ncbi:MAG: hypothetical protein ABIJ97_08525 [Bacteroidota bacterium]
MNKSIPVIIIVVVAIVITVILASIYTLPTCNLENSHDILITGNQQVNNKQEAINILINSFEINYPDSTYANFVRNLDESELIEQDITVNGGIINTWVAENIAIDKQGNIYSKNYCV